MTWLWVFLFLVLWLLSTKIPNFVKYVIVAPMIGCFLGMYAWALSSMVWSGLITWPSVATFNVIGIIICEFAAAKLD